LWVGVAGVSPASLRILPMLFGLLAIAGVAWLAFELFRSRAAALVAASIYAISPFAVLYAQEARETTLWSLEIVVGGALLLRAARQGGNGRWIAYSLISAISLYTYPLAAAVMAAHCVVVFTAPELRQRTIILPYVLASAAAVLVFVPWPLVLANTHAGAKALGVLLANQPSPGQVLLTFFRDIKATIIDVGVIEPGSPQRIALMLLGIILLAVILGSVGRMALVSSGRVAHRFILALFVIPALPILLIHAGALISQMRYLVPVYLATELALAWLFCASFENARPRGAATAVFATSYLLMIAVSAGSCIISSGADTWYSKAWQRSPQVAAIINQAAEPVVIGDEAAINDRGTSRVLEIAYSLNPGVAMRVNLRCEACLIDPPAPIDVFADADRFQTVFVLGVLKRPIPPGRYEVKQVGIDIDPAQQGPLEMFAPYPR